MKSRLFIILVSLALMGTLFAQEEILTLPRRGYFETGLSFQTWKREGAYLPVNQLAFPFALLMPVGKRYYLTISQTPGVSWQYADQNIYGLSDTWVQGTGIFWDEKLMINVGVGLQTGRTRLDSTQFELSKQLVRNLYRFRLPVYGQGLCGKAGMAFALPISESIVVGLGGQYIYRTAYHPVQYEYGQDLGLDFEPWDKEYRAGDEASGHLGVDFQIAEDMKLMLDAIYTYYWRDLLDNTEVYGSGDKLSLNVGFFYRFNSKYLWTYVIYRQKGKNELLQGLSFQEEEKNSNGYQVEMDVILKLADYQSGEIFLLGDARVYGKNEEGTGDQMAFGGGVGLNYNVSENSMLELHFKYLLGQSRLPVKAGEEGLEIFTKLRFML